MEFADVEDVCKRFAHALQVPNQLYSIQYFSTAEKGELKIELEDSTTLSLVVSTNAVQTLYTGDYDLSEFFNREFDTKLSLLYILSIVFFAVVGKLIDFKFEEVLSLILSYDIKTWKDLAKALCDYSDLECDIIEDTVWIEDAPMTYDSSTQMITCDTIDYQVYSFVDFVDAIFKLVDYYVCQKEDLLAAEEESEVIEMPPEEGGMGGDSQIMNISPDFSTPTGIEEEEPEVIEGVENENE